MTSERRKKSLENTNHWWFTSNMHACDTSDILQALLQAPCGRRRFPYQLSCFSSKSEPSLNVNSHSDFLKKKFILLFGFNTYKRCLGCVPPTLKETVCHALCHCNYLLCTYRMRSRSFNTIVFSLPLFLARQFFETTVGYAVDLPNRRQGDDHP